MGSSRGLGPWARHTPGTPSCKARAKNKQLDPTDIGSWPRGATTALQSTKTKHMKREILRLGKGRCQWSPA